MCSLITGVAAASGILIKAVKSAKTALTREVYTRLETIQSDLDRVHRESALSSQRLEVLHLLDHNPGYVRAIFESVDKYNAMGGNGYVEAMVTEWKKDLRLREGGETDAH